ncbi:MAG TPA: glucose-6-phosphate isomerase family protein [Thermoleophilia bacterium]|nr:glucose-6-phosphate isomerase family protein [Thermoleophilia bacterium]
MTESQPFQTQIDFTTGRMSPCEKNVKRYAEDMEGYFLSPAGDARRLIYETFERAVPHIAGEIVENITVVYPGTIGDEYFMTKGHYHENLASAEVYFCLSGSGYLLMESAAGDLQMLPMNLGLSVHVPPGWAHRSVNVGDTPLVVYALYPADAGHDYERVLRNGFSRRLVRGANDAPVLVNSRKEVDRSA